MTEHIDMAQFVEAKSDQLNADDLIGAPRTVKIRKVTGGEGEQPVSVFYEGDDNKPFKPCKTMRRVMLAVWGRYTKDYVGRSMTLYRDDNVTFGGLNVGGIRISHMSHMDKETMVVVLKAKGKKVGIKIQPLVESQAQTPTKPKQTAEEWADEYIGKVKACEALDDLIALQTKSASALAKLQANKPGLHELAVNAGTARATELQGASEEAFS